MTVITPVFMEGRGDAVGPSFFVASRGHHVDVGGISPGSMPPLSKTLEEVWRCLDIFNGRGFCTYVRYIVGRSWNDDVHFFSV